jgi:hypothetical protein
VGDDDDAVALADTALFLGDAGVGVPSESPK